MALNEQTEMAFGDQPPRIDPVSGNEVPPGALPSEVRDDIPARLSEGEYVVPADVLQYYGIKFFEDLRSRAKKNLAGLEENGRMGGEPLDDGEDLLFSADELNTYEDDEPIAANMGGMIRGYEEGGVTEMQPIGPRSVLKTYINDDGQRLFIRFVNGVAVPPVPPGYREEGTSDTGTSSDNPCPSGYVLKDGVCVPIQSTGSGDDDGGGEPEIFPRNLDKMNAAQLAQYAAEISKTNTYKNITKHPVIGFFARRQSKKVTDYLEGQIKQVGKGNPMTEFYQSLLDGIENGDRDGLEELVKEIKTNNPELNTKVLVTGSQISKDREKGSTVVDSGTKSNNTIGLGGTKFAPKPIMRPTAQEDAADSGGTTVVKTSEVDPFGIGSTGEFDTGETPSVDTPVTDVDGFLDSAGGDLQPVGPEGVTEPIPLGDFDFDQGEGAMATDDTGPADIPTGGSSIQPLASVNNVTKEVKKVTDFVNNPLANMFKVNEQLDDPTGRFSTAAQMEMNQEADVLNLMNALTSNPQNATNILSKSNLNLQAQDNAALASNLMSPRFGYESGRDDLQQRMVTGPGGVERLPLTDSQTLGNKLVNAEIAANNKRLAEIEARQAQIELDRETRRKEQNDADGDRDSSNAGDFTGGQTDRGSGATAGGYGGTGRGRSGYNKGGLASRKKKKKK